MDDDTLVAPPEGQEPEPTPQPTPEPEPAPEQTPEPPPPPPPPTQEEIMRQAEERAFQRMASWQGRRDKDLFDSLGNLIDSRLRSNQPPPVPSPPSDPATILENPDAWAEAKLREAFPRILDQEVQRRTQQDTQHTSEVVRQAGAIMDSDPLFQDKELGSEVIAEIQKNFNTVRGLQPNVAAQLLVSNAVSAAFRKRTLTKTNPLAGNRPVTGPMGTVKPPVAPVAKPKPVKLSEEAAALAKRWNYSAEDISKVFGNEA
uniref:Uncharacterized protein n=1 Tax=viral metagenome TaxID=1070528 RepID=A0A6M3LM82_9ZZZZ